MGRDTCLKPTDCEGVDRLFALSCFIIELHKLEQTRRSCRAHRKSSMSSTEAFHEESALVWFGAALDMFKGRIRLVR